MRESTRAVTIDEIVTAEVNISHEKLLSRHEDMENKVLVVRIGYYDANDRKIETKEFMITDQDYDLLMSESPEFAPGKPLNEYREVDLWHIIDFMSGDL